MKPIPILFLGDSPSLRGGLSRIGRDLATLTSPLPEFRVGYLGRGGHSLVQLPFMQYNFPESAQWGEEYILQVAQDFFRGEKGIIFSIWDASRLDWFSAPNASLGKELYEFLTSNSFVRWGYFPIDARSVNDKGISTLDQETIRGYDRVLAYSIFGAEILGSNWLPHGFDAGKFSPRDKQGARLSLNFKSTDIVIGTVMANQARKDWGLAFATMYELYKQNRDVRFWAHIDVMQRSHAWNLYSLIADYNAYDWCKVTISGEYNDEQMSWFYSACDLTVLFSLGEGFGYPIVESLSCGVPCVTGRYSASVELIPNKSWLVEPLTWRLEGFSNLLRPVYIPQSFVSIINGVLKQLKDEEFNGEYCRNSVSHLNWKELWSSCWKKWLLAGIK